MILDLGKLGASELKELDKAVKAERDRRGKRTPSNHDAPTWVVPNKAVKGLGAAAPAPKKPLAEITEADVPHGLSDDCLVLNA